MGGGLNIQNLRAKNFALLASLAWRIFQNPQSLWARTLLNKYLPQKNIWHGSSTWRNILKDWNHCQRGIKWKVGTRNYINPWNDPWINTGTTLRSLFTGPLPQSHDTLTVSTLLRNNGWNWSTFYFEMYEEIKKLSNKEYISLYTP